MDKHTTPAGETQEFAFALIEKGHGAKFLVGAATHV